MEKITVKANGKDYEVGLPKTAAEFVRDFGLRPERCLLEINGSVLKFSDFEGRALADGDVIEIMSLVAGG